MTKDCQAQRKKVFIVKAGEFNTRGHLQDASRDKRLAKYMYEYFGTDKQIDTGGGITVPVTGKTGGGRSNVCLCEVPEKQCSGNH
jgi:hypothetical protein